MNKNIKYLIENIQQFNPVEYQEEENNILDSDTTENLADPINTLINFLSLYNWKEYAHGVFIRMNDAHDIWSSILNKTKRISDEYAEMDLNQSEEPTADVLYDQFKSLNMIIHQLMIINDDNKGIIFSYLIDNNRQEISIIAKNLFYKREKLKILLNQDIDKIGVVPVKLIEKIKTIYNLKENE